ncbi:unnamed protein product, partial [Owenia fusiformis]
ILQSSPTPLSTHLLQNPIPSDGQIPCTPTSPVLFTSTCKLTSPTVPSLSTPKVPQKSEADKKRKASSSPREFKATPKRNAVKKHQKINEHENQSSDSENYHTDDDNDDDNVMAVGCNTLHHSDKL